MSIIILLKGFNRRVTVSVSCFQASIIYFTHVPLKDLLNFWPYERLMVCFKSGRSLECTCGSKISIYFEQTSTSISVGS